MERPSEVFFNTLNEEPSIKQKPIQVSLINYQDLVGDVLANKPSVAPSPLSPKAVVDDEALLNQLAKEGVDISELLEALEPTAAGAEALGEGGQSFVFRPDLSMGAVSAGYPTDGPLFGNIKELLPTVWWYVPNGSASLSFSLNPLFDSRLSFSESNLAVHSNTGGSLDFSSAFLSSSGLSIQYSLLLGANANNHGIVTTQGEAISFNLINDNLVEGVSASGNLVLSIALESNGMIEVKLFEPLSHSQTGIDALLLESGIVFLEANTNNPAISPILIDLGPRIEIIDDVPAISLTGNLPELLVDESHLSSGTLQASMNAAVAFNIDAGADLLSVLEYSLQLLEANSGLIDSQSGQGVVLHAVDQHHIQGIADGHLVFELRINQDTGEFNFIQFRALAHPDALNPDDLLSFPANLVEVSLSVEDGDHDRVNMHFDLGGRIQILDDGPEIITAPNDTSVINFSGKSFTGQFSIQESADAANHIVFVDNGLSLTSNGLPIIFDGFGTSQLRGYVIDSGNEVDVMHISLDINGSYSGVLYQAIDVVAGQNPILANTMNLEIKLIDSDGDSVSSSFNVDVMIPQPPTIQMIQTNNVISFTRENNVQQPYGDEQAAQYLLKNARDGQAVNIPVNGVNLANTAITIPTDITVRFVSEGAGHRNMIGYYFFDITTKELIGGTDSAGFIWVDTSATGSGNGGTNLITNPSGFYLTQQELFTIDAHLIPPNAGIGFFLIENGASNGTNRNIINQYNNLDDLNENTELVFDANANLWKLEVNGQRINTATYFTHDKTLNHDFNSFGQEHSLSGVSFDPDIANIPNVGDFTGLLIVGFEDLFNGGDRDYEDVVFAVDLGANVQNISSTNVFLIDFAIDPDSPVLVEAKISTQGFISGDKLLMVNNSDVIFDELNGKVFYLGNEVLSFTVNQTGHDLEIIFTGNEPQNIYEIILRQISFSPVANSASEGAVRTIDVHVTDETGLTGVDTNSYNVVINDVLPIQMAVEAGLTSLGSGDDVLLLPDEPSNMGLGEPAPLSGGNGYDTIKYSGQNMQLSLDDLKQFFSNGWEHIDMRGVGSNELNLDYDAISQLLDMGGTEIEVNGDMVRVLQVSGDNDDTVKINLESGHSSQEVAPNIYEINSGEVGVPSVYIQLLAGDGMPMVQEVVV